MPIAIWNMDPQIRRKAQTRHDRNALPKSHPRGDAHRKAEKRAHPQSPSADKHDHWSGKANTAEIVWPRPLSPKHTEKVSQIKDRGAGHPKNRSTPNIRIQIFYPRNKPSPKPNSSNEANIKFHSTESNVFFQNLGVVKLYLIDLSHPIGLLSLLLTEHLLIYTFLLIGLTGRCL